MTRNEQGTRSRRSDERGVALIAALLTVVVLSLLGIGVMGLYSTDFSNSDRVNRDLQALYAADAGVENAVKRLYGDYMALGGGNLDGYTAFLDGLGIPNGGVPWTLPGVTAAPLAGGATIQQVNLTRTDAADGVTVAVTSVGAAGARQVTVQESIRVRGTTFRGFDFALLANNVNCIMCHARIDNAERYFNKDASKFGTFKRVKVGTLEDFKIREIQAESVIAGTLYTASPTIQGKAGDILTDLEATTLDGFKFDANGNIIQNALGGLTQVDLVKATGDPLPAMENFYLDYPPDPQKQTDGALPERFPPPFEDTNADRRLDASEFSAKAAKATGSITGGVLYGVPSGSSYTSANLPSSSTADLSGGLNKTYTGNLILVGTDAKPITCNGDVAVNGDVIITGKVKGECVIQAKGNIYVVGDTTYADGSVLGNRTFGTAADGTTNTLGLVAGGNVLIGDYLTPQNGDITQVNDLDAGKNVSSNPTKPTSVSFTTNEIALFNRGEYERAQADPSYIPRYYQLRDGDPIYRYDNPGGPDEVKKYGPEYKAFTPNAGDSVVQLSPAKTASGGASWIGESKLKQFWRDDNAARTFGTPFQIDGLVYTSNAIFALSRSSKGYGSKTDGQLRMNGSLVAADVGVLVPGNFLGLDGFGKDILGVGLQLNYDRRVADLVRLGDPASPVTLVRRAWQVVN